jgi:hypothetical protein
VQEAWARLERCLILCLGGRLEPWQYNLIVESLGFSRWLKLTSDEVAIMRRKEG